MGSIDSGESYIVKGKEGKDKNGSYVEYTNNYQAPCSCHPETCCHFDSRIWKSETYRKYKNGKIIYD